MATNPFKTPEFKTLFKEWNKALEASGHKEIEDFTLPEPALKSHHAIRWSTPSGEFNWCHADKITQTKRYYELAEGLFETFDFESEAHRQIWVLHCEGGSVRKIAEAINQRRFSKSAIERIIVSIQRKSGLKSG